MDIITIIILQDLEELKINETLCSELLSWESDSRSCFIPNLMGFRYKFLKMTLIIRQVLNIILCYPILMYS